MKLPLTLQGLIGDLLATSSPPAGPIENFGIFIDTHRDQPHIGSFGDDIHRGSCRPVMVDLAVLDASSNPVKIMIQPHTADANGTVPALMLHEKHMFIDPEFWSDFLLNYLVEKGESPLDADGVMVTSHLRDARAKVYKLKSFRQMLEWRHAHK
jgi:hypothetical protein